MAIIDEPQVQRLTLHCVSWQEYQAILAAVGDRRLRHTYDRGTLEMMSPGREHERIKRLIAKMIDVLAWELNIPIQSVGSSTLNREQVDRGLEPDEAFYIAHESQVRGRTDYDSEHDPPPDLAVEIDVSRSSIPRLPVYAALGIPEVWRYRKGVVTFQALGKDDAYREIDRSSAFPTVAPIDIERFLAECNSTDETSWIKSFAAWVRQQAGAK